MATQFGEVYGKFLGQIEDTEMLLVDDNTIRGLMFDYLQNAIVEFNECRTSLEFNSPVEGEYLLRADSFNGEFLFNEYDSKCIEFEIFLYETETELELNVDYTLEFLEEGIKIKFLKAIEEDVLIYWIFEGEFVEDLNMEEVFILSYAMTLHWLQPKLKRERNLKNFISDKDFSMLSNANMLLRLTTLERLTRKYLHQYRQSYAFKKFEGWY